MTNTGLRIKRTRLTVPPRERSTERARIQARAFQGAVPKQTAQYCKSSTQSSKSGAERAVTIALRLTRRLEIAAPRLPGLTRKSSKERPVVNLPLPPHISRARRNLVSGITIIGSNRRPFQCRPNCGHIATPPMTQRVRNGHGPIFIMA
jgi:hypothetical protein